MAQSASLRHHGDIEPRTREDGPGRASKIFPFTPRERAERPPLGVHPAPYRIALGAAVWFLLVMAVSFVGNLETGYLLAIVAGLGVMFFGVLLLLGLRASRERRWATPEADYHDFVEGEVGVDTGRMEGREVAFEMLLLPLVLAAGATVIGIVFMIIS
jgi:hypothetical protein